MSYTPRFQEYPMTGLELVIILILAGTFTLSVPLAFIEKGATVLTC